MGLGVLAAVAALGGVVSLGGDEEDAFVRILARSDPSEVSQVRSAAGVFVLNLAFEEDGLFSGYNAAERLGQASNVVALDFPREPWRKVRAIGKILFL